MGKLVFHTLLCTFSLSFCTLRASHDVSVSNTHLSSRKTLLSSRPDGNLRSFLIRHNFLFQTHHGFTLCISLNPRATCGLSDLQYLRPYTRSRSIGWNMNIEYQDGTIRVRNTSDVNEAARAWTRCLEKRPSDSLRAMCCHTACPTARQSAQLGVLNVERSSAG